MNSPFLKTRLTLGVLFLFIFLSACGTQKETVKKEDCFNPHPNRDANCIALYQPVCGCDGKTYGNSCEAERAGIKKWKEGKCADKEEKEKENKNQR